MKPPSTLIDAPVFISNIEAVLGQTCAILHEMDRGNLSEANVAAVDTAIAMLNVSSEACSRVVCDIERGFQFHGTGGAV
ncbi:hypothetical protein ACLIR7_03780 [Nitratireductor aquimarinus]|uniref:hypothetical protein n=1 Tax=Nitratireductor aquimarinus TaxID=889300 RepID=UPI00398EEE7C